jgi:hypothetical protein
MPTHNQPAQPDPPQTSTPPDPGSATLLPGMAMVAVYMLIVALVGGFGALNGHYPGARYVILSVATLMVAGVFGLLRLRRWGWSLVTAGCLCLSLWSIYMSRVLHSPGTLVMAALNFCLFLYLIRTEVRERVR